MSTKSKLLRTLAVAFFWILSPCGAQQSPPVPQEEMHMHHHGNILPVEAVFPRLGRAQEQAQGKLFTLEDALRRAAESNPTLHQAEAEIRAAKARTQQAGLYPNPSVGYTGDEIRGGSNNGGKQGFFAEQTIVTGGKLAKSRAVFEQETRMAEIAAEQQKTRVETSVKLAYYRVLAAQELLELRRELFQIGGAYQQSQDQLVQTGQVDESEKLADEIELQRIGLAAFEQENVLRREWRKLAALIGQPDLPQSVVAGDLEHGWPEINEDQILQTIAAQSPATRIADAAYARASAEIARAKSQIIPDLNLLGGFEYNNEPLGTVPQAVGWEGLAEVSVQIPIFNRNQGNIAEANADLDRAKLEKQRIQLLLRESAASIVDQYATAKIVATQYRDEILPRAKKANAILTEKYRQMLTAYAGMLEARRKNFQFEAEYVRVLEAVWTASLTLQGFLLTGGLDAPTRPNDRAQPVPETNLAMPTRTLPGLEQMPLP